MAAPFIRVNEADNVGIIVSAEGVSPAVANASGFAFREGRRIHDEPFRDDLTSAPSLDQMPLATAIPPAPVPLDGFTFDGYRNPDGSVGTKNILGLATTVQCVAPTVEYAVRRIKAELLRHFPNVDDVVAITHGYGCGVAMNAPGAKVPVQTLKDISLHANLGARPLLVSLGCEKLQPQRMFASDLRVLEDIPVIRLQDEHGFADTIAAIMRAAEKRLSELNRRTRETCAASALTLPS